MSQFHDTTSQYRHDEACEICGENARRYDRQTRRVELSDAEFHVCEVCEPKLPREWQHDPGKRGPLVRKEGDEDAELSLLDKLLS